jgi:lipopolysaccharide biosynthesis regulator YciM
MLSFILLLSLAAQPIASQNFFAIVGSVRDETGHAVPSIRVSLEDENYQSIQTVFADSSGRFQFRRLRAGNYFVRIEATGTPYQDQAVLVPLQSMTDSSINQSTYEDTTPVDITLKRRLTPSGVPAVVFAQVVPPTARDEYQRGVGAISKNPESGIASLKKAIEIFPDYFLALELLGTQYVKLKQFENAVPILSRALAVNDKSGSSMYWLGVAYLHTNRHKESIEWLTNAAGQDSGNANVYMMLGLAYGNSGSLDQSETALKKAYQLGGAEAADAHLYLAGLYNKREKYADAIRELELYLKEAKGLKDKTQIKEMITKLKAKANPKQ